MPVTWIDYRTGEVTAFLRRDQPPRPAERITVYLYAHPRDEAALRDLLGTLTGPTHGYLSPLVPPGAIRAAHDPIDDEQAREVSR